MQYICFIFLDVIVTLFHYFFSMLKFQSGWKPACKFEDKRPIEDANNNAAMESNVARSAFMFSKENFSKNLRNIQTMDAKYED